MDIKHICKTHTAELMAKHGVVAVGIGNKIVRGQKSAGKSIVCSVAHKRPLADISKHDLVPTSIEGVLTDVVEVGEIKALSYTGKERPASYGASIGHFKITAGTLGCLVDRDGQKYILSNNHVMANSNDAQKGDEILQPGPHDGGTMQGDTLTRLTDFVPISFTGENDETDCPVTNLYVGIGNFIARMMGSSKRLRPVQLRQAENLVDAAIAGPVLENEVRHRLKDNPTGPYVRGVSMVTVGDQVHKSGRTTEYTRDEVLQTDVTVQVQYGAGKVAVFEDQFMCGPMSAGGDSGSLVLNLENNAVGLLFAGSDTVTICNRIQNVLSGLQCSMAVM